MEKSRHSPSPIAIQKVLGGLDYPVGKADLLKSAQAHGADEEIMHFLESIPDRQYDSPVAVSRQIGQQGTRH